jgi:hypothetical protein
MLRLFYATTNRQTLVMAFVDITEDDISELMKLIQVCIMLLEGQLLKK